MSVPRFAFALLSCLLLAGQFPFLSGQAYAIGQKPAQSTKDTRECCLPGAVCPTPQTNGSPGCKCCGFRVDGKLVEYKGEGKDSTLDLAGNIITFVVKDHKVDQKLKAIGNGNNGTFILKTKQYENSASPTGLGTRLECIDVGNTSIENRTQKFLLGSKISDSVFEVIEALLNTVPKYDPELAEDK